MYEGDRKACPLQARRYKENKWIGHEKRRCHCQGAGRNGSHWRCRGMVDGLGLQTLV